MPRPSASILCLGAWLLLAACNRAEPAAGAPAGALAGDARSAREVRSARVEERVWERTVRVTGDLAAFEQATLSAKVPGRLEALELDLGMRIERGQVVARIDARDYELRVAQSLALLQAARARLGLPAEGDDDHVEPTQAAIVRGAQAEVDDAKRARDRAAGLLAGGVSAQSALDAAESRLLGAQSRLQDSLEEIQNRRATLAQRRADIALARQQLADTQIRAPFDGAVAQRLAGTGDYLEAGAPVARVLRFDPLRLRLEVPEREVPLVTAGQSVRVQLEGARTGVIGKLVRLGPELGARSHTLLVEAELPNPDGALRPGSFARAEIIVDPGARSLTIPSSALVRFAGLDRVLLVKDEQSVEQRVTVGRVEEGRVEILQGLSAGDEVVLEPGNLQGGTPLRVAR